MPDNDNSQENSGFLEDYISGVKVRATPEEVGAVQVFAARLVEDYGYKKNQIQTHPQFRVRKRPSDEAKEYPVDIAVFSSTEKSEETLFMIVECKEPNEQAGLRQLKIYMDMSPAEIGVWFNGDAHAYIRKQYIAGGGWAYESIPNIPQRGQRVEDIGKFKRKDLGPPHNLKAVFKDIRNHLAGLTTGITRDEALAQEIINLLFCKIYDELNTGQDELVSFRCGVNEEAVKVKQRIVDLFENKVKKVYDDVFSKNDSLGLDPNSVTYIVGELQNYCVSEAERDVIGDAFEVFIGPALKGGEGQFFTPRNVVRAAVEILDPNPDESIIDPACGSGGFLIVAVEWVWQKIKATGKRRKLSGAWIKEENARIATKFFRGTDKDSFLAKVTKAYMAIVGDGRGGVFCENSLVPADEWQAATRDKISLDSFDIVLTNPPFGAKIPIKGEAVLRQYDLGFKWKKQFSKNKIDWKWSRTSKVAKKLPPQILFIERCLQLLKPGGRLAIVLPDGILGGDKVGYVAAFIKANAKIMALIDCPVETFAPMVTTKTHVVFLEKKEPGEPEKPYSVFMAVGRKVGHNRKGRPLPDDDLPTIAENYRRLVVEGKKEAFTELGFLVDSKWLEDNLIARRYLPEYIEALETITRSKHPTENLGTMKNRINTGANVSSSDYVAPGGGLAYILVDNITEEGINFSDLKYINPDAATKNSIVHLGDIIINRCGNDSGVAAVVPPDLDGAVLCGFAFRMVLKDKWDPYYVTAFLNSPLGRKQMLRIAAGSVLDHITKADLQKIRVIYLPKNNRDQIIKRMREAIELRMGSRKCLAELNKVLAGLEN